MMSADLTVLSGSPACIGGGAERVALDLHREFLSRDIDSWLAVATNNCKDPHLVSIPLDEERSRWARTLLGMARSVAPSKSVARRLVSLALRGIAEPARYHRILSGREDFGFPGTLNITDLIPSTPNVLHLHNLHGSWFDIRALPALSRRLPTLITMHDAWLLTGHCAHPFDCPRWETGCGHCPDLDIYVPIRKDASADNWRLKRDILERSRLTLISPSRWLAEMSQRALGQQEEARIRVIPNGVDTAIFHPRDRMEARSLLGITTNAQIILTSAVSLADNPFKDFKTLREALSLLAPNVDETPMLLALGLEHPIDAIDGIEVIAVPRVNDVKRIALHYQASDVYVHPARAENLPLAIIEAMACELPVVATNVGGISELVSDGVSGLLVPREDEKALAAALETVLSDPARRASFGAVGASRVRKEFTLQTMANSYLELYAELMEASNLHA